MTLIEAIIGGGVSMLGGGVLGIAFKSAGDAFATSKRTAVKVHEIDSHEEHAEREITRDFAIEERNDRRRMEREIRGLREELRVASVALAKSEAACAELTSARDSWVEIVNTLRTQVDMQTQLIERQRKQIDDLVRRLMTGMETA